MAGRKHDIGAVPEKELVPLFRQHLEEFHHITSDKELDSVFVREHVHGKQTAIPVSVFYNKRLSVLEAIVKYLREEEQLRNNLVAELLGRSPAAMWITYRNSVKKLGTKLVIKQSELFIPTAVLKSETLSALESISLYLHEHHNLSYKAVAEILNRDQRTIWTVCSRARRKQAR